MPQTHIPTNRFRWCQKILTNCTGNGEFREWESLGQKVIQQMWESSDGEEDWRDIETDFPTVCEGGFAPCEQDPPNRQRISPERRKQICS